MKKNRYSIVWDDPLWMSARQRILREEENVAEGDEEKAPPSDDRTERTETAGSGYDGSVRVTEMQRRESPAPSDRTDGTEETGTERFTEGDRIDAPTLPGTLVGESKQAGHGEGTTWTAERTARTASGDLPAFFPTGFRTGTTERTEERVRPAVPPTNGSYGGYGEHLDGRRASVARPADTPSAAEGFGTTSGEQAAIERIVEEKLSSLRVYVLESDITDAQNAVKTMVDRASF